ncbi:MAG: hypothetical protein JWQ18_1316 [Conexibacter sp.]|nr:hypothetical protein [Conexibacter sp.]
MPSHQINIVVVVNGQEAPISASPEAPLHSILEKALHETGNIGQGPDNWEFRDADGNPLDLGTKLGALGAGARIFLNLKAGIGG